MDPFSANLKRVGPYVGVFLDKTISKETASGVVRNFRLIGHGAMSAGGLMGSEMCGLSIVDVDARRSLVDRFYAGRSGYDDHLPGEVQKEAARLEAMAASEFETEVMTHANAYFRGQIIEALRQYPNGPVCWKPARSKVKNPTLAEKIKQLAKLERISYDAPKKEVFLRYGPSVMRELGRSIFPEGKITVRTNEGGVAVSGEIYLEVPGLYVWVEESCMRRGLIVTYRTKDTKTGLHGANHQADFPSSLAALKRLASSIAELLPA